MQLQLLQLQQQQQRRATLRHCVQQCAKMCVLLQFFAFHFYI